MLQIGGTERVVERDDFDEALALDSVEIRVRLGAGDADVLAGQRHGFVVLDGEVVIVHPVDAEGKRGGCDGVRLRHFAAKQIAFGFFRSFLFLCELIADDGLQAFAGGLDGTLVDVAADPTTTKFLRDGSGRSGADEAVENEVFWIRGHLHDAFDQCNWLLSRIIENFRRLVVYGLDVVPNVLGRNTRLCNLV